jgi:hypothetical protein
MLTTLRMIEKGLWWLESAGFLVLYLRLRRERLSGVYRFFSMFLVFTLLRSVALMTAPVVAQMLGEPPKFFFASIGYYWVWVTTEPLLWVLYILVVLELYELVFRNYQGIASLSRWAILAGLGISVVIAALTLPLDLNSPEPFPLLRYTFIVERGVASSLALFLILISGFLASFPVPLNRNVVVYSIGYAVYFLSVAATMLVRNVSGEKYIGALNIADAGLVIVCLIVWIRFLNRAGETTTATVRPRWEPAREQHLIEQLAAINSTLMRAPHK